MPPAPVISIATLFVLEIHITTVRICNSIRDNLRQSGYKNEKKNGAVEKHLHNILYHYITNFQKHRIEKKNPLEIGFKAYKINYENREKSPDIITRLHIRSSVRRLLKHLVLA